MNPPNDLPLLGLSYEEPRRRAISSSARPRLILGRSASDVSNRLTPFGLIAEDSSDEKYPLSSMDANFRLCDLVCDEHGKRGTGGGV